MVASNLRKRSTARNDPFQKKSNASNRSKASSSNIPTSFQSNNKAQSQTKNSVDSRSKNTSKNKSSTVQPNRGSSRNAPLHSRREENRAPVSMMNRDSARSAVDKKNSPGLSPARSGSPSRKKKSGYSTSTKRVGNRNANMTRNQSRSQTRGENRACSTREERSSARPKDARIAQARSLSAPRSQRRGKDDPSSPMRGRSNTRSSSAHIMQVRSLSPSMQAPNDQLSPTVMKNRARQTSATQTRSPSPFMDDIDMEHSPSEERDDIYMEPIILVRSNSKSSSVSSITYNENTRATFSRSFWDLSRKKGSASSRGRVSSSEQVESWSPSARKKRTTFYGEGSKRDEMSSYRFGAYPRSEASSTTVRKKNGGTRSMGSSSSENGMAGSQSRGSSRTMNSLLDSTVSHDEEDDIMKEATGNRAVESYGSLKENAMKIFSFPCQKINEFMLLDGTCGEIKKTDNE